MTNAPSPTPAPDGADPSMEEILASIRRILNDDETATTAEDATGSAAAEDDVLVLDDSMMVLAAEASTPSAPKTIEPETIETVAGGLGEALPAAEPPARELEARTSITQQEPRDQTELTDLVAPEAAAAAAVSVGGLMRALAAGRATQVYSGGPTLEDLVRSELRPLLKEWLDANLPPVVERLVRAEIERVVGRAVL
jgi:cell pole-organizing protein PopZ